MQGGKLKSPPALTVVGGLEPSTAYRGTVRPSPIPEFVDFIDKSFRIRTTPELANLIDEPPHRLRTAFFWVFCHVFVSLIGKRDWVLENVIERDVERLSNRNAISRDGEYRPFSMAMTVWRVTPMWLASSAWLISLWANLSDRIKLVTLVGLIMR